VQGRVLSALDDQDAQPNGHSAVRRGKNCHFLREQGVGSSNLPAPTNQINILASGGESARLKKGSGRRCRAKTTALSSEVRDPLFLE
jgi:hypothetical protein